MKVYDPELAPDPREWLELDEDERIALAETHHRAARIRLPNARVHACFHAIVENQIAEGCLYVVRAMVRLQSEGLSRHDALHAIGNVLAELLHKAATTETEFSSTRYEAAVGRMTAKAWRKRYGARR
ncbi:hypothetical protein C7T35_11440 [Variovorax sp. WS11]|uniref:hypothetical protein n=1 Tax=Variovorax sp. WS11 TaxID=1105204 RepID=UPI000D0DD8BE|nr:hypothetical protein [Variovorax sp. WS11]NDZ13530.1 hypothetical protein [Variovorax sp. WS11]PSL84366.1 hypothetical protein C7T35_11440 [Variovorax sp. WS11]